MWGSYEGAYICQTAYNQIWRNYIMWFEKRLIKIQKITPPTTQTILKL